MKVKDHLEQKWNVSTIIIYWTPGIISVEQIKKFQDKLKSAVKSRSKNVTLTIDEANLLLIDISDILLNKINSKEVNSNSDFLEIDSDKFWNK